MKKRMKINKNNLFANKLKKALKIFEIKNFKKINGYLFNDYEDFIIHFQVGHYQFGIWTLTNHVFAEHLGNIDKLKPYRCEYTEKYKTIEDIIKFVKFVTSQPLNEEYEQWLNDEMEEEKRQAEDFRKIYQYIRNYNGIERIRIRKDGIFRSLDILLNEEISKYKEEEFEKWDNNFISNCKNFNKNLEFYFDILFNITYYEF